MQSIINKNIPLSLQLINADLSYEDNAIVSYNIYNSDTTTIALSGEELSFNNILNSYTGTIEVSGWTNQQPGNYLIVWSISNTNFFASTMIDTLTINSESDISNIENTINDISTDIKRLLGLNHENIFIDNTKYDVYYNLISARVRIYSISSSVGTDTNIIGTYQIDCKSDRQGTFTNWKQIKVN